MNKEKEQVSSPQKKYPKSEMHRKIPLELYLHIPFCIKKCLYCDFLSFTSEGETREHYTKKLIEEIKAMGSDCNAYEIVSVFIGGGTPSVLEAAQTCRIMEAVSESFSLSPYVEITTEANPGTVDQDKLTAYKACGINRLSLGLQSASEQELKAIGRIHTFQAFLQSFREARTAGFDNINVDLMSALPGQTIESYKASLKAITDLSPEHISAYSLIIEEGTPFYEQAEKLQLPDEETERSMYHYTKQFLKEKGYARYEISNYSKPGKECVHNTGYWKGTQYLGLGLNSSSCLSGKRFSNEHDINTYLSFKPEDFQKKSHHKATEILTRQAQMEEFMFLGLRLTAGVSTEEFQKQFGVSLCSIYGSQLEKYLSEGLIERTFHKSENPTATGNLYFRLTDYGIDVSNYVLSAFLL